MSQSAVINGQELAIRRAAAPLAGVALASFASLLLELALTRLFSVILFYHFAFLAISIALLGLGAGGVFAYLRRARLAAVDLRRLGTTLTAVNALVIVAVLEIVLHVPVALDLGWGNFGRLTIVYIAAAVPFFFTGLLFSVIFAREPERTAQLYGADLIGGAVACVAVVPLLDWTGGPNAVLFSALAMAIAAFTWAEEGVRRRRAAILAGVLVVLIGANYSGRLIDIVYAKGKRRDQPWMLFSRWNAISRVEVDQVGEAKYIVIDADASTAIMNVDPRLWDQTAAPAGGADKVGGLGAGNAGYNWKKDLMSAAPSVVNVLRPQGTYAIIGPGGGVDVLRAVANGSRSVTGIEINPIIANTIMRGRYAEYAYHLYELPQVHLHVSDGRSWLRSSRDRYDVVQMTLVDTWASTAAGAFALSENNLYTLEAFREYFDHLTPDGIIAITRWEFARPREALRVMVQEMEVLRAMGVPASEMGRHFVVVSDGALDRDGRPVAVLAKKTPFTPAEVAAVRKHVAENSKLVLIFPAEAANAFAELASTGPQAFATDYTYDVSPVSDNAPFFFFTFRVRQAINAVLGGTGGGMDWKNNLGVVVLAIVLVISIAAVLGFLIVPLAVGENPSQKRARTGHPHPPLKPKAGLSGPPSEIEYLHPASPAGARVGHRAIALLYFVAIGLGYIMVEIVMIQRFVLFLGHPTYALTVVVFLMMLSSGAGSLVSRQWAPKTRCTRFVLALVVAGALVYVLVLPKILAGLVGIAFGLKLMVSGILLAPLAFVMGMPFPSGLRALTVEQIPAATSHPPAKTPEGWATPKTPPAQTPEGWATPSEEEWGNRAGAVEWAWAMNASASVLGSILAMVLAIGLGLSFALGCAAAAYAAAILFAARLRNTVPGC
jgi:hypothetical protein